VRRTLAFLLLVLLGAPSLSYAAKGNAETASLTSTGNASKTSIPLPPSAAKSKLNGFVQRAAGRDTVSPQQL
jgi:hypothetical protein